MVVEIILILISILVLAIASYNDLKTREIPDYISYLYITSMLGISLIYSLYGSFSFFLYAFAASLIALIISYVLYRTKQIGGGDVKLFVGIAAALANLYLLGLPLLFLFVISILFIGGLYTFIWGLFLFFKNYSEAKKEFKILLIQNKYWRIFFIILSFLIICFGLLIEPNLRIMLMFIVLLIMIAFYLITFIRVVESLHFIKLIPVSKLTEGDWLARDVKHNNKIILSSKIHSLEKKHITLLKRCNISKVLVKIGIPFVPAIFLSFIATIIIYGILG